MRRLWRQLRARETPGRAVDRSFIGIADLLNKSLDLETMAQQIVDLMIDGLGSSGGVLFLVDEEARHLQPLTISSTRLIRRALAELEIPFREHRYPIDRPENQIGRCASEMCVFRGHDVAEFLAPNPSAAVCRIMQRIVGVQSIVALPVLARQKLVGVNFITFRSRDVTDALLDRLHAFNNLVATAIATCTADRDLHRPDELRLSALSASAARERMEDEFLALVSHELGSPLISMRLLLSILEGDAHLQAVLSAKHRRFFHDMLTETNRLHGIVSNVERALELARERHQLNRERVSLGELAREVIRKKELEAFASGPKISLTTAGSSSTLQVLGDPHHLEYVLWELLTNAVKHSGPGVQVLVAVRACDAETGPLVQLQIRDDGPGVPAHVATLLGRRFNFGEVQMNKSTPGLGLGLYVVKRVLEAHGGSITVEAGPAGGTDVRVRLPQAP